MPITEAAVLSRRRFNGGTLVPTKPLDILEERLALQEWTTCRIGQPGQLLPLPIRKVGGQDPATVTAESSYTLVSFEPG